MAVQLRHECEQGHGKDSPACGGWQFGADLYKTPALRPELVAQVGLMIADPQYGPFWLLVKPIMAIESTAANAIGVVVTEGDTRLGDAQFNEQPLTQEHHGRY